MIMFKRTYENAISTAQNVGWHNGYNSARDTYRPRAERAERERDALAAELEWFKKRAVVVVEEKKGPRK